MNRDTICVQGGYTPGNGEPRQIPIIQSTTFKYATSEDMGKLFDLEASGYFYTRLQNPTNDAVAAKISQLEGGTAAMLTSSGQAANFYAVFNIAGCGDHVVASSAIYGGSLNLFAVTLKRLGIEVTFVSPEASEDEIQAAFRPNTKALFGETIANPSIEVLDIEKFARIAHRNGVPLLVDNTFATPVLCRPIEFGADIVVHSTTKYMDGHALQMGGVIVDGGTFDWTNGKFPEFTEPDDSYHGTIYTQAFGKAAYIVKARTQIMRDMGACQTPFGAFLINQGLETLPLRIERHSQNADAVAHWLEKHDKIESVSYPTLEGNPYKERAAKYLPNGCSGVISFSLKGGREAGARFIDSLKMASLLVHVADIRTCVLHPASSTHRQLTDEQLVSAGITPGMVRLSVGIENIKDILADLEQALAKA